jgi:hypothetical protein
VTNPDLYRGKQLHVQIVTEPGDQQGRTVIVKDPPANVTACYDPKADEIRHNVAQILALPRDGGSAQ